MYSLPKVSKTLTVSTLLVTGTYPFISYLSLAAPQSPTPQKASGKPTAAKPGAKTQAQLQPAPNRDRLTQPQTIPSPLPSASPRIAPPATLPTAPERSPSSRFTVQRIEVSGSSVFQPADFASIIQPLQGKSVTLSELQAVANQITQRYLEKGYITSRAIVTEQAITNGVVTIQVLEGSLDRIEIQGNQRLNSNYIRDRVKLGSSRLLNSKAIEDQLQLLKDDPLLSQVEASLKPGSGSGKSELVVRVKEAPAVGGSVTLDNYSPPTVGSERITGTIVYRNLTGIGDQISATYARSLAGGSNLWDFSYRVPLNPMNGTLNLRYAPSNSKIIDPNLASFDIRSQSELFEVSYRQPVIRTPRQELALSIGFAAQNGQTFLFNNTPFPFGIGPDANGNSRTRVIKFGQDYVSRDGKGVWAAQSQFNFGLNALDATTNPGNIPDGQFFSWQGQLQRVQQLSPNYLLIVQGEAQLTPDNLLPSQQFVIGGGQSVRGYRQSARSGDNGVRLSIENRFTLQRDAKGRSTLQLAPFADFGTTWNNPSNPNSANAQNVLASAGLGLLIDPTPNLFMRLDYAIPIVSISDRGNNAQDHGLHFNLGYRF